MTSQGMCIAVVSGKGGTGKTSFVSGVGTALAQSAGGYCVWTATSDCGTWIWRWVFPTGR